MSQQQIMVPGAAGVAIKCKDGVVLGNDKRATWGYTVTNKSTKKVFKLTDNIGMAAYGLIGDFQMLTKIMRAQANLYELDAGEKISTRSMGKLVSNYLYSRKMFPLYTNVIIAGMDKDGPALYSLDAIGSLMPDNYGTTGTSMLMAVGILEAEYDKEIKVQEGEQLVEKVIRNSLKRDAMAGNGIDLLIINEGGAEEKSIEFDELGE
ncbi:MAG: proteasome subunit beta [Promethearchaeia archaeon]